MSRVRNVRVQRHSLGASEFRGGSGQLAVEPRRSRYELHDVLIKAGQQAGYPVTDDFNGPQQEGFGFYDMTIGNGVRARCQLLVAITHSKCMGRSYRNYTV